MKTKTGSKLPTKSSQGKFDGKKPSTETKAGRLIDKFRTGTPGDRMNAAHEYRKGELWKAQNHGSLKESVEKEQLGVTYPSFLRLANAGEVYENLTGEKCSASCVETALRPLTSLSEKELYQVKNYITCEGKSLAGKSPKQVRTVILNAFAKPFSKDEEYIEASDDLVRIVTEKMAKAKLTSTTAINLVATAIANKVELEIRKSLTSKPTKPKKSKGKKADKNS